MHTTINYLPKTEIIIIHGHGFHWCSDSLEDKIKIMVVNLSRTGLIAGPRFQGYDNSCSPLRAVSSTGYQKQLQATMIFCLHELIFSLTFL
ncbi:hypothetical protein Peur_022545 [Populus x canadensis]